MTNPNGHPSSCPCTRCNDYDLGALEERAEAKAARWGYEPPDSRAQETAGGWAKDEPRKRVGR